MALRFPSSLWKLMSFAFVCPNLLPFKEIVGICNMADCVGGRAVYSFHFLFTSIYNQPFKKEPLSSDFREIAQDI